MLAIERGLKVIGPAWIFKTVKFEIINGVRVYYWKVQILLSSTITMFENITLLIDKGYELIVSVKLEK